MQVWIFTSKTIKVVKIVKVAEFFIIFVTDCLKNFSFQILLLVILKHFEGMHQPTLWLSDSFQQFVESK